MKFIFLHSDAFLEGRSEIHQMTTATSTGLDAARPTGFLCQPAFGPGNRVVSRPNVEWTMNIAERHGKYEFEEKNNALMLQI